MIGSWNPIIYDEFYTSQMISDPSTVFLMVAPTNETFAGNVCDLLSGYGMPILIRGKSNENNQML